MHELSIARTLWESVINAPDTKKLTKISKITVILGEASGFEESFLRHSLVDHVLKNTIAENAELNFEKTELLSRCNKCGVRIKKEEMKKLNCPVCGSSSIEIVSGKEVYVKEIEGE